jgi:hypothetical protein
MWIGCTETLRCKSMRMMKQSPNSRGLWAILEPHFLHSGPSHANCWTPIFWTLPPLKRWSHNIPFRCCLVFSRRLLNGRIHAEYLPPYAPELNPVEYIWAYWKQHELPNMCPKDYWQLSEGARGTLRRMRRRQASHPRFLEAGLSVVRLTDGVTLCDRAGLQVPLEESL